MTPQSSFLAHLGFAEVHVRNARQSWDPSSLAGCQQCSTDLDQAIAEMKAACDAASAGPVPPGTKVRLGRLRGDVEALSRLVDAAMSFGRGLALRAGAEETIASELKG